MVKHNIVDVNDTSIARQPTETVKYFTLTVNREMNTRFTEV